MIYASIVSLFARLLTPVISFAQVNDIFDFQILLFRILVQVSYLFYAMTIALFIWGVIKFINNANDSAEHEKGKSFIVWSIICFLVIVSLWAIVQFLLLDTFGIMSTGAPNFVDKNGGIQ